MERSIKGPQHQWETGQRRGAVVRALGYHQCVPRSISGPGVICVLIEPEKPLHNLKSYDYGAVLFMYS